MSGKFYPTNNHPLTRVRGNRVEIFTRHIYFAKDYKGRKPNKYSQQTTNLFVHDNDGSRTESGLSTNQIVKVHHHIRTYTKNIPESQIKDTVGMRTKNLKLKFPGIVFNKTAHN